MSSRATVGLWEDRETRYSQHIYHEVMDDTYHLEIEYPMAGKTIGYINIVLPSKEVAEILGGLLEDLESVEN